MTAHVDWHAAVVITAGLIVLIGLTGLLRGGRAAGRVCCMIGFADVALGLAAGKYAAVAAGAIVVAVVCWALRITRGDGE
jgi:hypothetical protein